MKLKEVDQSDGYSAYWEAVNQQRTVRLLTQDRVLKYVSVYGRVILWRTIGRLSWEETYERGKDIHTCGKTEIYNQRHGTFSRFFYSPIGLGRLRAAIVEDVEDMRVVTAPVLYTSTPI